MRLDKFIADSTDYSRADVKKLIKQGRVTINAEPAENGGQKIQSGCDQVCIENQPVQAKSWRYFMLHKPKNRVCANTDSDCATVLDLFDEPNKTTLQIAGRLDKDTTGLVLLTDDGQWNHKITSPARHCIKTYKVTLERKLSPSLVPLFKEGIQLRNEKKPTRPAQLTIIDDFHAELSIQEGRYHQV